MVDIKFTACYNHTVHSEGKLFNRNNKPDKVVG